MSTILAYTSPAIGHLFPLTPLLLELQRRGHSIQLRTLADQLEEMRALGFDVAPIDPRIEGIVHDDYKATSALASLTASATVLNRRGEIDAVDFRQAWEQALPDLSIVDVNCWGAAFAAEALGEPWVSFDPTIPFLSSPGTPPFGPGVAPMGGPIGRIRDAVLRRAVLGAVEKTLLPSINTLRSDLGLAGVASADEFARKAPLMLVATAKPFEYAATDWGPQVVMIGASAWEPPSDPPDWLAAIEQPIALVTTSSEFQDDGRLVDIAIEALTSEPLHVVATMPAGTSDAHEARTDVTIREFVPHRHVLSKAAVAITHGGMGATQKALTHGVPVCAVPFGRDQAEVARRVEVSGSGTRLPAARLTPARLRRAVGVAITRRAGARRVAAGYEASGGPAAGADAVEHLLAGAEHQVPEMRELTTADRPAEKEIGT